MINLGKLLKLPGKQNEIKLNKNEKYNICD